jgi:hypothetical protein
MINVVIASSESAHFKAVVAISASAALLLLSGCSESYERTQIQNAVKDRLLDPYSVKFETPSFTSVRTYACIEYNAKNAMGGYAGPHIASLDKTKDGNWVVHSMDEQGRFTCSFTSK